MSHIIKIEINNTSNQNLPHNEKNETKSNSTTVTNITYLNNSDTISINSNKSPSIVHEQTSEESQHSMLRYGDFSPNHRFNSSTYLGVEQERYRSRNDNYRNPEELKYHNSHLPRCSTLSVTPSYSFREGVSRHRSPSPRERRMLEFYGNTSLSVMERFGNDLARSDQMRNRELYGEELRQQIQDNHHRRQIREEQNRLDQLRLEQHVMRMQELDSRRACQDDQLRRHSEDLLRRKQDVPSRLCYRRHMDSESSVTSCLRHTATDVASKSLSHYSPPVSRRTTQYSSFNVPSTSVFDTHSRYNPSRYDSTTSYNRRDTLRRMESLNSYDRPSRHNAFHRFDSLSRIDSLTSRFDTMSLKDDISTGDGFRRHSATHQDLSFSSSSARKSPRLQRRASSGRFEDPLPAPILKAHSPVARELKNSVPFNSARFSDSTLRRLEDRWSGSNKSLYANLSSFRR